MTSWSGFPPRTTQVQFDEKWSFVGKKEAHCDRSNPADDHKGDDCDHVAYDPEHRLVVSVVPGAGTIENPESLVEDFRKRTGGRLMRLMTSDESPAYETAIRHADGETVVPDRTGKPGRPKASYQQVPEKLLDAVVEKTREKGRVVKLSNRVVFGTMAAAVLALALSKVSRAINTSFVERENGTDRHRNSRKARKTYRFSKEWRSHEAATYLSLFSYNFCWVVRTLVVVDERGSRSRRTAAMAAGLTDHVWSMAEWLARPAIVRQS